MGINLIPSLKERIDLDELKDVEAPTPSDGDSVVYDEASELWLPQAIAAAWAEIIGKPDSPSLEEMAEEHGADGKHGVITPESCSIRYTHPSGIQCTLTEPDIPAAICRDAEADSKIADHKGDASAHHSKTTAGELNLADLAEKAHGSLTGIGSSDHHAKTGDNEVYGLVAAGLAANRPAAGINARWYFSTDTLVLERDNGTSWVEMARGETAIRLAQLSEKAHSSLSGIGASDHHAPYTHPTTGTCPQDPKAHDLAGAEHNSATLAQLNAKVSDATLIDVGTAIAFAVALGG